MYINIYIYIYMCETAVIGKTAASVSAVTSKPSYVRPEKTSRENKCNLQQILQAILQC